MKVSIKKLFYSFASVIFIMLLLLPLTDQFFHFFPKAPGNEQRILAELPELRRDSLKVFPKRFEKYYEDNFGLRQALINLGAWIKYHVFHSSAMPDKVIVGEQDWLFLCGEFYCITQDLGRKNLYSPEELEGSVKLWEKRKQELGERQIKFYKAFWPDKHYIYPELMPFGMRKANAYGPHRCDQVIAYLKEKKSPVQYVDVREDLTQAKKDIKIYHQDDSHWNSYGAFIAYTRLMTVLAADLPQLKPYPLTDFKIDWVQRDRRGDLATLLNLDRYETDPVFVYKKHMPAATTVSVDGYPKKTMIYVNDSAATPLKALIYRDSYTTAMIPFLMLHFSKIVFIWDTEYSIDMVEKVKPDVVIECYASRYFR